MSGSWFCHKSSTKAGNKMVHYAAAQALCTYHICPTLLQEWRKWLRECFHHCINIHIHNLSGIFTNSDEPSLLVLKCSKNSLRGRSSSSASEDSRITICRL